jgi:ribosomal protein S18 acetylase RimI-like enzyme
LRPAALRLLHDSLPPDQRSALAQVLSQIDPGDEAIWAGLMIARAGASVDNPTKFDSVIWVQRAIGNTAVVWAAPDDGEMFGALLRAAAGFVDAEQIPLAQMVVGEHDGYSGAVNQACGFPKLAGLAYLFAEVSSLPDAGDTVVSSRAELRGAGDLQFVPRAGDEPQRLCELLEQTYLGTLDCPALDRVRPMPEVLAGYRAQGRHSPDDWYFLQLNGVDVGALILAEHAGFGNWELVYMGVVPTARGKKIGDQIIRFALEVAARRGTERLVLAVDEANTPALRAYERAGFVVWDRRLVYARLRTQSQHSANADLPRA